MAPLGALLRGREASSGGFHGNRVAERLEGQVTVADIGFSGPGSPELKTNKGTSVETPTFFVGEGGQPEDELTMSTVETPRERAMRVDGQESLGQSMASAPKV
jgi:hypothetical protein